MLSIGDRYAARVRSCLGDLSIGDRYAARMFTVSAHAIDRLSTRPAHFDLAVNGEGSQRRGVRLEFVDFALQS